MRGDEEHDFCLEIESQPVFAVDGEEQHSFWPRLEAQLFSVVGEEEHVFWPVVEAQPVSAVIEDERHISNLDVMLEHDRGWLVGAPRTTFFVLSGLALEQLLLGTADVWSFTGDNSVGEVLQQVGNPNLSISVQRHSARSSAAFHCARERCTTLLGLGGDPSP